MNDSTAGRPTRRLNPAMNLFETRWMSHCLGFRTDLIILAPDPREVPPPWATLYLLHGRTGDASDWTRYTTLERQADRLPLLIAMPSGHLSLYRDPPHCPGMESALITELIPLIEATFPVVRDRSARAVAGLSMGGYGALYLGTKHPEVFAAVSAHSPVFREETILAREAEFGHRERLTTVFPEFPRPENTLAGLIERAHPKTLPAIRFDTGTSDFVLDECRLLHELLTRFGIHHEYAERQGGHDWNYWEKNIGSTLRFVATKCARHLHQHTSAKP